MVSCDQRIQNSIDCICIGQKFRRYLLDVRVKRGSDAAYDHHLVVGKFLLKLQRFADNNTGPNTTWRVTTKKCIKTKFCEEQLATSLSWTCHVSGLWDSNIPQYFYFTLQVGRRRNWMEMEKDQGSFFCKNFGGNCWEEEKQSCHLKTERQQDPMASLLKQWRVTQEVSI